MHKRILIVDDEESVVFFLGENMTDLGPGYEVETACSGMEALEKISIQPFDVVIADLCMPGMDGLELLKAVRIIDPDTHLILITAYVSDRAKVEARHLQVYRHITKPFKVEDLMATVCLALGDRRVAVEHRSRALGKTG